jgi:predicted nucleotidyltransferase
VPPIDIQPKDLQTVLTIMQKFVANHEVWAFGSRVTKTAKEFSDFDIAIVGQEPLPASVQADLEEAFRESDLPFKVDVVDWATVSPSFKKYIKQQYVIIQKAKG